MAISEIPSPWNQVLEILIDGPVAWRTPEAIVGAIGGDPETLIDAMASMDLAGWLDVWECPEPAEIRVTLSTWAANRLGVRLVEFGKGLESRWVEAGQPEPPHSRARGVAASGALEDLDLVLDSLPAPGSAAIELDDDPTAAAKGSRSQASREAPILLIGDRLTPWPGPVGEGPDACPACQGLRLGPRSYCLRCDRWGRDPARSKAPSSRRPARSDRDRMSKDREARDLRKVRRRARLRARFATESSPPGSSKRAAS